jgi:transcriptional regulator with XRE-family HTH domain
MYGKLYKRVMNKRLKQYLEENELPPEDIALKVGVSVTTISRLDPVKPPKKPLALAIMSQTGLTWDELFPEYEPKQQAS